MTNSETPKPYKGKKVVTDGLSAVTANLGTITVGEAAMSAEIEARGMALLKKGKIPNPQHSKELLRKLFNEETRPGYEEFQRVLHLAYHQTAFGKGNERHGSGKDWLDQSIMLDGRECGPGSMAFQVQKKAKEAVRLSASGRHEAAKTDILGAIVYAVAEYLLVEEAQRLYEDDD